MKNISKGFLGALLVIGLVSGSFASYSFFNTHPEIVAGALVYQRNSANSDFDKTKTLLMKKVYSDSISRVDAYCGCKFDSNKKLDKSSCWFISSSKNSTKSTRDDKIEFEHVFPAENFGRSFVSWRDGNPKCIDSKGKSFKGRACSDKVDSNYRAIQSDVYNLVPAVWELNAIRSNNDYSEIPGEARLFWKCDFEVQKAQVLNNNKKTTVTTIEPPANFKWDAARIYRYMEATYWLKISDQNRKLFAVWEIQDPISKEECDIYKKKKLIQNNTMFILEEGCKNIK